MTLEIISTSEILFKGEVTLVTLPGEMGAFTVLKNHASIISVLVPGKILYRSPDGQEETITVKGGIADVDNNIISVCIY